MVSGAIIADEVINIDKEILEDKVIKYFCEACRFDMEKEKYKKMLNNALDIREKILDKIEVKAVISYFEKDQLSGRKLTLNDIVFNCNAFELLNNDNIKGIYAYILTAGDVYIEDDSVLNMFYADTWGTAYVDAGRDYIREKIKYNCQEINEEDKIFISDSFGPGYYGMNTDQIFKFFEVLDGKKIDTKLTKNGMILPLKSCTGIYIATNDEKQLPKVDCKECISNPGGCQFCRVNKS